jgi:hypothetical protein
MFQIPDVENVYLYQKPISMRWGEKKLTALCKEEMGIDPGNGGVFLFYNSKRNELKLFFHDRDGWEELSKRMPRGGSCSRRRAPGKISSRSIARRCTASSEAD